MVAPLVLKAADCTRCQRPDCLRAFGAVPQLHLVQRTSLGVLQRFALDRLKGDPRGHEPGRADGLSSPRFTWIPAGEHAAL